MYLHDLIPQPVIAITNLRIHGIYVCAHACVFLPLQSVYLFNKYLNTCFYFKNPLHLDMLQPLVMKYWEVILMSSSLIS
jgi:hypothetical protein